MNHVTGALKRMRGWPPLNRVATSTARTVLDLFDARPPVVTRHLHRVGPVSCGLPNGGDLRMWSLGDDGICNHLFWGGWTGYEPETTILFYQLAQSANVVLDIGAHVGYYALLAHHANPRSDVYAFEPLPSVFERLQGNVARNATSRVRCVQSAVGERAETASFYYVPGRLPTSSSLSYDFNARNWELESIQVPVVRIDDFARENRLGRIDLVKIDTETTEPSVLRGMTETIRRDRPTIICEVLPLEDSHQALEEILRPLGYTYYHLTPAGPVRRAGIQPHHEWYNYLFVPVESDRTEEAWRSALETIGPRGKRALESPRGT